MLNRVLLLSTSIILIIVSYPGGALPLLSCVAVAPALIATAKLKPLHSAFVLGLWAWLWWCLSLWWASESLSTFSEASTAVSLIITALVCLSLALPYAICAYLIAYLNLWHGRLRFLQIPLCFAVFISLFSGILPAAPVNALFEFPILLQLADIGGLPLLVFFYFVFNAALASLFIDKQNNNSLAIALLVVTPLIVLAYGQFRLSEPSNSTTRNITIGYIQPMANADDTLSSLIGKTQQFKEQKNYKDPIELIIWPEVPVDFSWHDTRYERYRIRELSQELNSHLIILSGYHYANGLNAKDGHYNSANLISNRGQNLAEYRKQKLVPFFEYLPFRAYLSAFLPNARNYIPGNKAVPFQFKSHTFAPLICYEALFTDLVRPYIEAGADVIINPGNDGWFGETGALSHLSLTLLRTIEYRIPLIRVNNSGVSTVINEKGEIVFETLSALNEETVKAFTLSVPKAQRTVFYQYGDILNIFSILLLACLLLSKLPLFRASVASTKASCKSDS